MHPVLVGRSEVVQILPTRLEGNELDRLRILARVEHDLGTITQQVEGLSVGREPVGVGHRLSESCDGRLGLDLGVYLGVDVKNRRNKQLLHQRIFKRTLVYGHGRLVPERPAESSRAVRRPRFAAEPAEDGLLYVAVFAHEVVAFRSSRTRTRPVRRSCMSAFLSSVRATILFWRTSKCDLHAFET